MVYRQGTSAFILNNKKEFILVIGTIKHKFWKIPAGGVDYNESQEDALHREIKEELDIKIDIIAKSKYIVKYKWPKGFKDKLNKGYIGQEKSIFIVKLKDNQTIKTEKEEIEDYKWVDIRNYKQYISIPDQLKIMEKVIDEFKEYFE